MHKHKIWKKGLVLIVILLFIGMSVVPSTAIKVMIEKPSTASFDGNTLYVGGSGPGNYSKIQDAIDNASDGDTVYVFNDSSPYKENIVVNKSINLVGENRDTTMINGDGLDSVIRVKASSVIINNFYIYNSLGGSYAGISVGPNVNNNEFINNSVSNNNGFGYNINDCSYNLTENNIISNNENSGIHIRNSNSNTISNNTISGNQEYGIEMDYSDNNKIVNNEFQKNRRDDLYCSFANNTYIYGNIFVKSSSIFENCIDLSACSGCTIKRNTFEYKGGVFIGPAKNIRVTENNFMSKESILFVAYIILVPGDIWFEGLPNKMNIKVDKNYWYESRFIPKRIDIMIAISILFPIYWIQFDWHPAQEPYDIGV